MVVIHFDGKQYEVLLPVDRSLVSTSGKVMYIKVVGHGLGPTLRQAYRERDLIVARRN